MEDPKSLRHMFTTELLGIFFLIFAGGGTITTDRYNDNVVTVPGIAGLWGFTMSIFVSILGFTYGAHFCNLITILHVIFKSPPLMQVPIHVVAQDVGSIFATDILKLIFSENKNRFVGIVPAGSNLQIFVIEFIISFYTLFIILGVFIDRRKIRELVGQIIGATLIFSALFVGY
ncbi:aquaporin NIP1-2-like [Vicia villosa]|uniref:aquaporin NIP1-2-like n=1 Tax=Vicia villosa TaxID=3911 RepID=UPI00273BBF7D|nr:aquaporin NIP1-2-like [Vicia villosa]